MRIAQVSTVCTPVRAEDSGSVETIVYLLAHELIRLGHDVTTFATADSTPPGELVATLPGAYDRAGAPGDWQLCEWINLCRAVEQSARFDVLHTHAYLWGLPLQSLARAPMVHTTHVLPGDDAARLWRMTPEACVTGISHYQWSAFGPLQPTAVIHHGVDVSQFTFRAEPEDYVCFFGRFVPEKGPLVAIATARALGLRLLLAGPRSAYYRERVEPLVDGRLVEYVGYLTGRQRDRLLGGARALLYPVQYPEPFGLVMVESMMCGTPVAAIRLGAVPELVDDGVTGDTATSVDDFPQAVQRSLTLDRRGVRTRAQGRFSADRMAAEYLRLYARLPFRSASSEAPRSRTDLSSASPAPVLFRP